MLFVIAVIVIVLVALLLLWLENRGRSRLPAEQRLLSPVPPTSRQLRYLTYVRFPAQPGIGNEFFLATVGLTPEDPNVAVVGIERQQGQTFGEAVAAAAILQGLTVRTTFYREPLDNGNFALLTTTRPTHALVPSAIAVHTYPRDAATYSLRATDVTPDSYQYRMAPISYPGVPVTDHQAIEYRGVPSGFLTIERYDCYDIPLPDNASPVEQEITRRVQASCPDPYRRAPGLGRVFVTQGGRRYDILGTGYDWYPKMNVVFDSAE